MHSGLSKLWTSLRRLAAPTSPHSERLVDCPTCGVDLMNPVSWHDVDESTWWIRLRCGACGSVGEVEASNEEAQRLATSRGKTRERRNGRARGRARPCEGVVGAGQERVKCATRLGRLITRPGERACRCCR